MNKFLLVDANNLACRCAFANEGLTNSRNESTSVHYGMFSSLVSLKEKFPHHQFVLVWDGKSKRRMKESEEAVQNGLIKTSYKANRKKDEVPQELIHMQEQLPYLQRALHESGIPQIRLIEFEADDVVSAYCKSLNNDAEEIVCLTSDHDYYQLLDEKVSIYDSMKDKLITKETFKKEFGIEPKQHVDVGALMGDNGDNIISVSGLGEKTALKWIQEHGSWEEAIAYLKKLYEPVRAQYPDVTGEDFKKLANIRTPAEQKKFEEGQEWKGKYPDIQEGMPFSGIALAFEEGKWKPTKELKSNLKINLLALMFESRIKLAYSLKKMDDDINDLPPIIKGEFNKERILEYLDYYDMDSLKQDVDILR